jgi:hypothetical protein
VRQTGGSHFAKLLTLQNRANVKDHAPQDITLVASLLYQKNCSMWSGEFWNAAKMAALPVNGLRGSGGGVSAACGFAFSRKAIAKPSRWSRVR